VVAISKNAIINGKRFQLRGMFFSLQAKEKGGCDFHIRPRLSKVI